MLEHLQIVMINGWRGRRGGTGAFVCAMVAVVGAAAARRWLWVVDVDGSSMLPTYADGDRLLAVYGSRVPLAPGSVVVARAPNPTWTPREPLTEAGVTVVKRVTAVGGDLRPDGRGRVPSGTVYVEGDAVGGYDSRVFGPLPRDEVRGRVLVRLSSRGPRRAS